MDFINQLFSLGGSTIVIVGAFLICLIGYAIGHIQVKGICLGTAGVFLVALLFGFRFFRIHVLGISRASAEFLFSHCEPFFSQRHHVKCERHRIQLFG